MATQSRNTHNTNPVMLDFRRLKIHYHVAFQYRRMAIGLNHHCYPYDEYTQRNKSSFSHANLFSR